MTVTDAEVVARVLGAGLLGGRLPLDSTQARRALDRFADLLRLSADETVVGIRHVVRAAMGKAMRLVLARRGLDPRAFTLVAFGGAGPMQACALARDLGIRSVLVPFLPGAFSAYGILISPVRLEYGRSVVRRLVRADRVIRSEVDRFQETAVRDLEDQGRDPREATFEGSVDLRFHGQSYEINIPLRGNLASAFRREHRRRFGYASEREPIELVTVRLVATLPRRVRIPPQTPPSRRVPQQRRVLFDDGWQETSVLERSSLSLGDVVGGPAIIEEDHATTVVPSGARLRMEAAGILRIEVGP